MILCLRFPLRFPVVPLNPRALLPTWFEMSGGVCCARTFTRARLLPAPTAVVEKECRRGSGVEVARYSSGVGVAGW